MLFLQLLWVNMSDKVYAFKESLEVGKSGEDIIWNWLASRSYIVDLQDVSNDRKYQKQDIDFLATFKDGTQISLEIKTDTYTTGNIYFETISDVTMNTKGCMYVTKADFLLYYFINDNKLYIIKMDEYKKWFNRHKKDSNFKHHVVHNTRYESEGYTFPANLLLKEDFCKIKEI